MSWQLSSGWWTAGATSARRVRRWCAHFASAQFSTLDGEHVWSERDSLLCRRTGDTGLLPVVIFCLSWAVGSHRRHLRHPQSGGQIALTSIMQSIGIVRHLWMANCPDAPVAECNILVAYGGRRRHVRRIAATSTREHKTHSAGTGALETVPRWKSPRAGHVQRRWTIGSVLVGDDRGSMPGRVSRTASRSQDRL